MALPEEFAQFILRTIFDLTEKSVSKIYRNVPIFRYPRDVGNFTRWGAALLGLSVFADEPIQPDLLADAIAKFTHLGEPSHCEAGTYLFSSLAHTLIACGPEEILNPVSYLMEGRCQIEFAFRKGGIDDLCSLCFPVILKTQKAFLEAHKHKDVIKRFLRGLSKGEDFEHLFKFLREQARNEKEDYLCGLKSALKINGETYDEEVDIADSEEAETNSTDGSNEAESSKKDGFEEAETYKKDGSEVAETCTTYGSNEAETYEKDGFEEAETYNRGGYEVAETYTADGSDSDGTKSSMEVNKASSDEKTVFQVSSDEEIVGIGELMWRLRALMMNFIFELHCFSQDCDVEPRMEEFYQEVLKAEYKKNLQEYSFEQAMMELKGVIPSVILEQFKKSADEAHKAGSESADNLTTWGSALLGISIQNGGKGLQAAVEKLDHALSLDSDRTDTLCYVSCAYGSLYCLTFGSPESKWYLDNARACIVKALRQDPDEYLLKECVGFIFSLEEKMVSGNKEFQREKRKYGDAFV